jgi:pimeloyl-ACP methyl ester carboxylesterase
MDLDADDPAGIVQTSILPQFYGDEHQPDAITAVRAWCAELPDALDQHDTLVKTAVLTRLEVPVSIIWGREDRYLNPSLADEIAALFEQPSVHLLADAGHYPQHDQPNQVAELLKNCETV